MGAVVAETGVTEVGDVVAPAGVSHRKGQDELLLRGLHQDWRLSRFLKRQPEKKKDQGAVVGAVVEAVIGAVVRAVVGAGVSPAR